MRILARASLWFCFVGIAGVLLLQILAILDLYGFEWKPLLQLAGLSGVVTVVALDAGLLLLGSVIWARLRGPSPPARLAIRVALGFWVALLALLAERTYLAHPITSNLMVSGANQEAALLLSASEREDFAGFSLAREASRNGSRDDLAVMYLRTVLNARSTFERAPLGATIDRYANQHGVDPNVLFFFAYVCSFWGEALPGPMPFFREVTPETLRDLVQVHLPGWFIESSTRARAIEAGSMASLLGESIAFKIRYALHKATLDVSTQPYDINLFTDAFLVMREYPEAFPELTTSDPQDQLREALRTSFHALKETVMLPPYEEPYARSRATPADYARTREDLKRFARATYYLLVTDFDFATRVIATVVRYQQRYYEVRIGAGNWNSLPSWQRASLLGMTRDLYVPNVGRLGPNLYPLSELNGVAIEYVAKRAVEDADGLSPRRATIWRPRDYTVLWGGAGTKLRILSEVWKAVHGSELPGLAHEDTLTDARTVVNRHLDH